MRLVLPEPPSANRYWRRWKGRIVKSPTARQYQERVGIQARLLGHVPLDGPVKLTLWWFRGRKAGDLSNRVKVIEDALNGVLYGDDRQVVELHMYRADDKQHPRIEVEVVALEQEVLGVNTALC